MSCLSRLEDACKATVDIEGSAKETSQDEGVCRYLFGIVAFGEETIVSIN